jgi:Flp pilus assembly protein CpaB
VVRFRFRSPLAHRAVTTVVAVLTAYVVAQLAADARDGAARYGRPTAVVVATRAVPAGAVVRVGDVERRTLPLGALPDGYLTEPPVGRVAVVPLFRGQVVVAGHVARPGANGVAALVPRGWRAVAVPTDGASPPLRTGDRVDVLATFGREGQGPPTAVVASGARVLTVRGDTVTIAVPAARAPQVAFAVAAGAVTLALAGA